MVPRSDDGTNLFFHLCSDGVNEMRHRVSDSRDEEAQIQTDRAQLQCARADTRNIVRNMVRNVFPNIFPSAVQLLHRHSRPHEDRRFHQVGPCIRQHESAIVVPLNDKNTRRFSGWRTKHICCTSSATLSYHKRGAFGLGRFCGQSMRKHAHQKKKAECGAPRKPKRVSASRTHTHSTRLLLCS